MFVAMLTAFEQVVVILIAAAVPVLVGYVAGQWWAILLSLLPLPFGYFAYGDYQWELMILYVPPFALMLAIGVGLAKLKRMRQKRSG